MNALFSYWHFDPGLVLFIIGICLFYSFTVNFKITKKAGFFVAAIALIILCTASPLHFLGKNYLFSAHMLSHVLILLIAGPLIVASIPAENRFQKSLALFSRKLEQMPFVAWISGVAMMWLWHVPAIFNQLFTMKGTTLSGIHFMSGLMYVHFISLLLAGMLFSWPVLSPYHSYRLRPLIAVLYLSTACVFCSLLGLVITFSHIGTYTPYLDMPDRFGFLPLVRNGWGISAAADQQIAGLIMWVPCCFIYLSASMFLLIKWFGGDYRHSVQDGSIGLEGLKV